MDRTLSLAVKFTGLDKLSGPLKNIALGSRGAAKNVAKTTRELAELGRAQDRLGRHKALQSGLQANNAKLDESRRRIRALREEIAQTDAPTKRLKNSLASATREEARLTASGEKQAARLRTLQAEMKAAGVDTRRLADHERELARATHDTTERLAQQQRRLAQTDARRARVAQAGEVGGKLQTAGVGAAAAGAAIGAPLFAAAGTWREFQSGMTDVAQKGDTTREALKGISDEILRMGPAVGQLPTSLQHGLDTLAGLGMEIPQAVAALAPIGKTATAYKADVDDLSNAVYAATSNLKLFAGAEGDAAEQQRRTAHALDVMAVAGKRGGFELKDMAKHFPSLTARAQALGQSGAGAVADLSAALQIARRGAGDADEAATNVQNALAKINMKDTIDNFKKFGVDLPKSLKRAYAQGKTPLEAIAELTNQALKGDLNKLPFLFGDMQAQSGIIALIQNLDDYKRIRAEAAAAGDVVDQDFVDRMRESAAITATTDARMQALGVRIGSVVGPKFDALKLKAGELAERFLAWGDRNPELFNGLVTLAAAAAAVLAIVGPLAIAIGFMAPGLMMMWNGVTRLVPVLRFAFTALRILGGGFLWLARLAIANPFLALIGGLILAAYLIYTHWAQVKAFFVGVWQEIRAAFAGGIGGIAALIVNWSPLGLFYRAFAAVMSWFGISLPAKFTQFGSNIVSGLVNGFLGRLPALKAKVQGVANSVAAWFKSALGIHSPSRVFMGLGGFLTQGLAIGVDRGAAQPLARIRSVAGQMAAAGADAGTPGRLARSARTVAGAIALGGAAPALAATPAAGGPGAAGAGAAPTINYNTYHIRIDGSTGDVRAMARELKAELARIDAQDRAASYEDD
jgi:hypothetical protein